MGLRSLIFIMAAFIVFSGCIEEKNVTQSNESVQHGQVALSSENLSSTVLSSKEENIPEIKLTSFSSFYMHDNFKDEYLFCWDNVPGSENQGLITYLQEEKKMENWRESGRGISWGNHAQINKSADNKTIRVYFTSSNSTKLLLEDHNKVLKNPDVELEVKGVNGKYKVLMTPQTLQSVELEGKEVNGKLYIYKVKDKPGYNLTESYYAVYGLSIKNDGSKDLDFKLNGFSVRDGDNIFNSTIEPEYPHYFIEALSDLDKETINEDITLFPGQTINGSVVFQVNSLYNKSFQLMYNQIPIPFGSFEKSIEALRTAEQYNYSVVFDIPPYNYGTNDSYNLDLQEYPYIWSNWVNRSMFEVFNKADCEYFYKDVVNSSMGYMPRTEFVYALKVIPEKNITLSPTNHLIVDDDTGEELVNISYIDKIAILKNQTYELHSKENMSIPQLNFSNVTIVRISFMSDYNWGRLSAVNQDIILNKKLSIVAASNNCRQFIY